MRPAAAPWWDEVMFTDHLEIVCRTGSEVVGCAVRGVAPAGIAGSARMTTA